MTIYIDKMKIVPKRKGWNYAVLIFCGLLSE